ncbi:MAG TPA: amidase [Quisquiliibacterium sp.]|nr:amidase [Quisquiliibacterium sp.]
MRDLWFASATDLAREVRQGRLRAAQLLEIFLERVDRINPSINAIVVQDREGARARAAQADEATARGIRWGPLHGVPVTLKESNDRAGMPSTWGYPDMRENVPERDAVAVARLEAAGAIVFGKTNVPVALADFQTYNEVYGVTRNPWNPDRVPGGSSGGAAAALAAGLTALEIGSDIGGSIRNPSHFCGVFGHKPSWELIPSRGHGLGALRPTDIAVVGPMARSATDLELALRLLAGPDEIEAGGFAARLEGLNRPISSLRVAVWADDPLAPVSAETSARVRKVAQALAAAGAEIDERARPDFDPAHAHDTYLTLLWAALAAGMPDDKFERQVGRAEALSEDDMDWASRMLRAQTLRHRDWLRADEARTALRWAWHRFFQRYDVMLMPVMPVPAFAHDHRPFSQRSLSVDGRQRHYFECLFWAGLPGASLLPSTVIPTGAGSDGLPIGVQIVGPAFGDLKTIQLAQQLESRGFSFVPPPALVSVS